MSGVHHNSPSALLGRTAEAVQDQLRSAIVAAERDRGASMVEYGLMLVFVLLAAFFTVQVFGDSIVALFEASAKPMENAPDVNGEG